MPHLTMEYTANLAPLTTDQVLLKLNQALIASGQFEEVDIKSRAICLDTFLIGSESNGRGFIHVKLALLSGRSSQIKREISEKLLYTLQQAIELPAHIHVQLCVEVQEIERECYTKATILPSVISGSKPST